MHSPVAAMSTLEMLCLLLLVVSLSDRSAARSQSREYYPRNITYCDSGPSGVDAFDWSSYQGRWFVSHVSTPISPNLRDKSGYVVDIDFSSIERNARDRAWDKVSAERKEILYSGDSRRCQKREWRCVRDQGTSQSTCYLNSGGRGGAMQRSRVIATDYISTAAVYRETYAGGQMIGRQVNLMVRNPQMDPDPSVISGPLFDFCGRYAAEPGSEFYNNFSNDPNKYCLDYDKKNSY